MLKWNSPAHLTETCASLNEQPELFHFTRGSHASEVVHDKYRQLFAYISCKMTNNMNKFVSCEVSLKIVKFF